jgi:hypothetical protein
MAGAGAEPGAEVRDDDVDDDKDNGAIVVAVFGIVLDARRAADTRKASAI